MTIHFPSLRSPADSRAETTNRNKQLQAQTRPAVIGRRPLLRSGGR